MVCVVGIFGLVFLSFFFKHNRYKFVFLSMFEKTNIPIHKKKKQQKQIDTQEKKLTNYIETFSKYTPKPNRKKVEHSHRERNDRRVRNILLRRRHSNCN